MMRAIHKIQVALLAITALSAYLLAAGCGGCAGASQKTNDTLTAITAVADPMYEATLHICEGAEAHVLETTPQSAGRDAYEAKLKPVRTACDAAVSAFDAARSAQLVTQSAALAVERCGESQDTRCLLGTAGTLATAYQALGKVKVAVANVATATEGMGL